MKNRTFEQLLGHERFSKRSKARLRQTFLLRKGLISTLLFAFYCAYANYTGSDVMPVHTDGLSSNWIASAKAVLPVQYQNENLNFQEITNLLCQENQRGNNAAQGLWGFALIVQGHSTGDATTGMRLLRGSAEKGYIPAMLNLGVLFEGGKYVEKDYNQAFHWFSLAADKGNPEGQLQLGGCYHYGLGVTQNFTMAAKWYRSSAVGSNYVAMKSLGYLLLNGLGLDKNLEAAKYWLTRAANEGDNRRAMYNLGALCCMKSPDTNSMREAFQWYKKGAELGDPLACLELGFFYYRGWGVLATNLNNYRHWLYRAATLGSTEAQYLMGQAYRTGDGVPKDVEQSLMWYRKAASKNHPMALYDLALHYLGDRTNRAALEIANDYMERAAQGGHREAQFQRAMTYFRGDEVPRDFQEGNKWLRMSAENGWAKAEFALFQLFYKGGSPAPKCTPYPKNEVEAVKWLRRAAEHENSQAQAILAVMLIRGIDVKQDKEEAEKLLRNAATHGYAQAQNDLGFAILNGDASTSDFMEAAMWCRLAESHSTDSSVAQRAEANLSKALARLTSDQQLEVDRRVKTFRALPISEDDPMSKDWKKNPDYQQEDDRFGH